MEKLLISKEWDQGYAFYAFKPKGYVDNFFERTSEMVGIGFDKRRGQVDGPRRVNNKLQELNLFKRTPAGPLALSPLRVLKAKGRHGVLRLS